MLFHVKSVQFEQKVIVMICKIHVFMQKPYHGSSRGMTKEDGTPKSNILGKSVPQPFWTVSPRKVSYSPIPKKEKKEKMAKVLKYYVLRINSK